MDGRLFSKHITGHCSNGLGQPPRCTARGAEYWENADFG
jgi:hypothetical protein